MEELAAAAAAAAAIATEASVVATSELNETVAPPPMVDGSDVSTPDDSHNNNHHNIVTPPPMPSVAKRHHRKTVSPPSAPPPRPRSPVVCTMPWKECQVHRPTLEQLQSQSLSDYVRTHVLQSTTTTTTATTTTTTTTVGNPCLNHKLVLHQGMAKVVLPPNFASEEGIAHDRTARGPHWQAGTPLGDYVLESPIQQNIRGLAGVYEYIFTDQHPISLTNFRNKADAYRTEQLGTSVDKNSSDERLAYVERQFWKRLGPTMPPAWYGADQEGSLFGNDPASGWSLNQLDSCLHLLTKVPGVTSPYLYWGMWASVFCVHTEDMNLLSINYLHAGAPKLWYAVAPGNDAARLEALAAFHFSQAATNCKEFLRHKRYLISPKVLQKAGIPFTTVVQRPGEAVITFPGGYHFGFNTGFNVAEATNFAVPEWIPFGMLAKVCMCRPDSVRIDMNRFTYLLRQYDADQKARRKGARLSWKEWGQKRDGPSTAEDLLSGQSDTGEQSEGALDNRVATETPKRKKKVKLSDQERKHEFWIEVMTPVGANGKGSAGKKHRLGKSWKRKSTGVKLWMEEEQWHLAKPCGRKRVELDARVLIVVPATTVGLEAALQGNSDDDESNLEEEEQCFAGTVTEIEDNHVRVHFGGLPRSEDVWIPINSPKLFLDGGRWGEEDDKDAIPPLHYWKEMDSKRRCVEKSK